MSFKNVSLTVFASLLTISSFSHAQQTNLNASSCGYATSSGVYSTWPNPTSYQGWTAVTNNSGETALNFKLFLDLGTTTIRDGYQATYEKAEGGYIVTSPSWLQYQTIPKGAEYRFGYIGTGEYPAVKGYVLSINGKACDTTPPQIQLIPSKTLFTSNENLVLTANATDDTAVVKVVYTDNGNVIGQSTQAPFSFSVPMTKAANGRHSLVATAYDPSGNVSASKLVRVFTAIDNRFLGTAVDKSTEFADLSTYFNQLTPGNAGKWGSVESTRNVMKWDDLDYAYNFAKTNHIPFKLHTLIWGQQYPSWIDSLTPEEQLKEIEEWMSALATRYPDVATIDVVNEPLHAPPSFKNALGGNGVTGWDWMIKSFSLARKYFPNTQLLLNDYQILIQPAFTQDYLKLVNLLKEQDLIDGIGLQSHFLERAELDVVKSNLDILAATGLPIYISEFDLNFKNDAQHANRMRDLFTIFWDNPSVVGLTHWGYLQGYMWRENAYLIRSDKTLRPGMQWLLCYYAGASGCTVPYYEPSGWSGDTQSLTIQAEEYDEGKGVVASGNVVSYTDLGDYISFKKVNFLSAWDRLAITYYKGNTGGTVSFHIDSPNNPAILEQSMESSGGWGTSKTIDLNWPVVIGQHDLYIKFNNSYGVANLDSIRLHSLDAPSGYGINLVSNANFEDGTTSGWSTWNGTITPDTFNIYRGNYALRLSNRNGNGPAVYNLKNLVKAGSKYQVKMWASISGAESAKVNITSKIGCSGTDSYNWIVSPVTINNLQWVELSGQLSVPNCTITSLLIYAEGPSSGIDIYLDDISVREYIPTNLVSNGDFELGTTTGWSSWNGTVAITTEFAKSGLYSLKLSNRNGNGPAVYNNLKSLLVAGKTYTVSMAVRVQGAATAPVNITRKLTCGSSTTYSWVANTAGASDSGWTQLTGDLSIPADCVINDFLIYAEGPAAGINLLVDDVSVTAK